MSITIEHLEGPLAGQVQTFDNSFEKIMFGRSREEADVVYPPDCTTVGVRHFELRRTPAGDYHVALFGKRYVAMDGYPVLDGAVVKKPAANFRIGGPTGPSFTAKVGTDIRAGYDHTEEQPPMPDPGEWLRRIGKRAAAGTGAVAALLVAFFVYSEHQRSVQDAHLAAIVQGLDADKARASDEAETAFSSDVLAKLNGAVYLVARREGSGASAEGTAFAIAPDKLATNAHVTEAIKKGHDGEFFLRVPGGAEIKIKSVESHPGYGAFKLYKKKLGSDNYGEFTPLDVINEYDVGIIEIDPSTPLPVDPETGEPVMLELASANEVLQLAPGAAVASSGFPVENLAGKQTAVLAPPKLRFGYISALTDVFMANAEPDQLLLIQHSVPVTGGASGSPLIDSSGKVIGIVNGGNTTVVKDPTESATSKTRAPNAALINFAQRADLLHGLANGTADKELAEDKTYWEKAAAQFANYFDTAVAAFLKLAKKRYAVNEAEREQVAQGTLSPAEKDVAKFVSSPHVYKEEAQPGFVYGFIADSKSGELIGINVKKKGSDEFLKDAKDPRQTSERELAPTAWVTVSEPTTLEISVWSYTPQEADYVLYAYRWEMPKPSPSADVSATSRK